MSLNTEQKAEYREFLQHCVVKQNDFEQIVKVGVELRERSKSMTPKILYRYRLANVLSISDLERGFC